MTLVLKRISKTITTMRMLNSIKLPMLKIDTMIQIRRSHPDLGLVQPLEVHLEVRVAIRMEIRVVTKILS